MVKQAGIPCPECGTHLHEVVDSRKRKGAIFRRRACFNGHRFTTSESLHLALLEPLRKALTTRGNLKPRALTATSRKGGPHG